MARLPVVLIPGLISSPRFYEPALAALWRHGPVVVANHTQDDSMAAIARRILADAPPHFALAGHSMGGYLAFEIMRQAGERVARLALLDTTARADTPEQTERRRTQIAIVEKGRFDTIPGLQYPLLVHPSRLDDAALRETVRLMAEDNGAQAFIRQQTAIMNRIDSRDGLAAIQCPTLVLVGDSDALTPPDRAGEIAGGIRGSRLVTVSECGHMCLLEQPAAVVEALLEWMAA
ncbi:MAG: alpha/beta fold hydrolase [Betaproteobacteria bacterium]|nr:alpha/beta fold hydrolase [Betaproteobacteria bacterium]